MLGAPNNVWLGKKYKAPVYFCAHPRARLTKRHARCVPAGRLLTIVNTGRLTRGADPRWGKRGRPRRRGYPRATILFFKFWLPVNSLTPVVNRGRSYKSVISQLLLVHKATDAIYKQTDAYAEQHKACAQSNCYASHLIAS